MPKEPHYYFDIEQQTPEWYAAKLGDMSGTYLQNYLVSKTGLLKNKKTGRVLHPVPDKDGYLRAVLVENGVRHAVRVHRVVCETFNPNPDNKPMVNHKDGNPQNNNADNLEWVTNKENLQHAIRLGLFTPSGDNANYAKITYSIAENIRKLYAEGTYNKCQLGKMFGVSRTLIKYVVNNERWVQQ